MNKMSHIKDYVNGKGSSEERYNTESFFYYATLYYPYISKRAQELLHKNQLQAEREFLNGNQNAGKLANCINTAKLEQERRNNREMNQQDEKVLRLQKNEERRAGFINASILLYAILNIGILIAVTLIIL